MEKNKCLFFVYGTLKKGYGNHGYHLGNAKFLGDFITEPKYTLFNGGFPVVERGGDTSIKGELYLSEDPKKIQSTFDLEGCSSQQKGDSRNWYDFDEIETEHGPAVMFVMNKGESKRTQILNDGIWK